MRHFRCRGTAPCKPRGEKELAHHFLSARREYALSTLRVTLEMNEAPSMQEPDDAFIESVSLHEGLLAPTTDPAEGQRASKCQRQSP